jgi:cellulose synthase/poly-beta-1,6-N-acetylglucosamine synthase-like glycosyltransferase
VECDVLGVTVLGVVALSGVLVAWILYPMALAVIPKRASSGRSISTPLPTVTVVVATREVPAAVVDRVDNLRASAYPGELLDVVVAVDVSSNWPVHEYQQQLGDRAVAVAGDAPGGKAVTLNAAVRAARGEVLVFADTGQRFAPDAIALLVHSLGGGCFDAVSGRYETQHTGGAVLEGFWRFEQYLRRSEARVHSIPVVTGAIYAMRRRLWAPLPAQVICDDLWVPLELILRGHRVGYCEEALAVDPRRFTRTQEFRRKVRTLTGILQLCAWMPQVLVPWRNPVWTQFICHKLLRVATPFLVVLAGIALIPPVVIALGRWLLPGGGIVLGVIVATAVIRPATAGRLLRDLSWAMMLLMAPVPATYRAARRRWDVWG